MGWLDGFLQQAAEHLIGILIGAGACALFRQAEIERLRRRLKVQRPSIIGEEAGASVSRQAVVFTLGLGSADPESLVFKVYRELEPEWVGFLGSPQTRDGQIVERICQALRLPEERVKREEWDPNDVREGFAKANLVFNWLIERGIAPEKIILDVTGGTVPMSIAAFLAAREQRIETQYIASRFDPSGGRMPGTERLILIERYERGPE